MKTMTLHEDGSFSCRSCTKCKPCEFCKGYLGNPAEPIQDFQMYRLFNPIVDGMKSGDPDSQRIALRHLDKLIQVVRERWPGTMTGNNQSRPRTQTIEVPTTLAESIADSIRKSPVPYPGDPGAWSTGVRVMGHKVGWNSLDNEWVVIEFPPAKPDIPALIRAWHADPTADNRKALWRALIDRGMPYYHNGSTYAVTLSTEGPCAIEVT